MRPSPEMVTPPVLEVITPVMVMASLSMEKLPSTEMEPLLPLTSPKPEMKPPRQSTVAVPVISPDVEIVAPTSIVQRLYFPSSSPSQSRPHTISSTGP